MRMKGSPRWAMGHVTNSLLASSVGRGWYWNCIGWMGEAVGLLSKGHSSGRGFIAKKRMAFSRNSNGPLGLEQS